MKRIGGFVLAGSAGFLADAGVLAVLLGLTPLDPFMARALSVLFALCVTWALNRSIAFGPSSRPVMAEGSRYGAVALSSALVNYGLYAAALTLVPFLPPHAALVFSSLGAMAFSYFGYSRFVFDR